MIGYTSTGRRLSTFIEHSTVGGRNEIGIQGKCTVTNAFQHIKGGCQTVTPRENRQSFLVTGTFASSDPVCQIDTVRISACCRLLKLAFGSKVSSSIAILMSTRVPMKAINRSDTPVPFLKISPFRVENNVHHSVMRRDF